MTSLTIKDFDNAMNLGATNKGAVSKLVKAWEAKNDQSVKRAAGLGLMAVSLAACGGSDDSDDGDDVVVPDTPVAYSLTDERDLIVGLDGEELTISGAAGTLNDEDVILGTDSGDDVLNVTIDGDVNPTISGIETINVTLDVVRGADAILDATAIDGSTITVTATRAAFDGEASVTTVGDNWTAPIEWSGLNVSAWWASGPSGRWFPALGDGIPRRCAA